MVIDCWNDTECLAKLSKVAPYLFILLGFLVAAGGQFAKARIDSRAEDLNKRAEAQRKATSPVVDVRLGNS